MQNDDGSSSDGSENDNPNANLFNYFLRKKEDPLEKIKKWKPKKYKPSFLKHVPKTSLMYQTYKIEQKQKYAPVLDGVLLNNSLVEEHVKDIPEDWEEFRRMTYTFFQDEENSIVKDVQHFLYHLLNAESIKLLNF